MQNLQITYDGEEFNLTSEIVHYGNVPKYSITDKERNQSFRLYLSVEKWVSDDQSLDSAFIEKVGKKIR